MATGIPKRKTKRRGQFDVENITVSRRQELLRGRPFLIGRTASFMGDVDHLRAAWEIHRDDLRKQFINTNPGERPFAEWLFEIVPKYGERPVLVERNTVTEQDATMYGILHSSVRCVGIGGGWDDTYQETEESFLDRHGLLTDAERAALAANL